MQVLPRNAKHLALPYHLCGLDPLNHCPRRCGRPRSLHGTQPPLNVTVIGFDTVIAVAARSLTATPRHMTIGLKFTNGRWITPQSVSRDNVRRSVVGVRQCPAQEQLGGLAVACFGQIEIDGLTTAIVSVS